MSDKIYAACPDDFRRRMQNWARAVTGQLSALRSSWSVDPSVVNHGLEGAPLPMLEGEALDTDAALRTLPERYRWAVEEFWTREGRSLRQHARGREIDHHTMCAWVMRGHELLRTELARRTELWRVVTIKRSELAVAR
jgi:hypothetical protein